MSTTLTNGLKLPDKGSVDWYADMQNNYNILDGAVGTIAEHTSALAGKAPLVHTHTKSDVTDLFNSANTWSGENKYTSGFILSNISWSGVTPPSSTKPTVIEFKNSDTRQGRYINRISSTSSETWIETIRNVDANTSYNHTVILKVDNSGNKSVYPSSNNDIDLGIAANQWNNLYAKNYYYNGVAWGLDKANVWSANNTYSANCIIYNSDNSGSVATLKLRNSKAEVLSTGNTASDQSITFRDKNDVAIGYVRGAVQSTSVALKIGAYAKDSSDNTVNTELQLLAYTNGKKAIFPSTAGTYDLGTSSAKWKTLNGINPGALSIFNPAATQDPIDVPNTWITDGSAWNTLNVSNMGDGWICLTYRLCGTNDYILARFGGTSANTNPSMIFPATMLHDSKYYLYVLMPVAKAMGNIYLEIKLDSNAVLVKHSFIPAYGTV